MRHPEQRHRTFFLRRILAALTLGTAALAAGAPQARACGMEMFYTRPVRRTPDVLLAQARRNLAKHENVHALLLAQTVIDRKDASAAERAEGYAILGWIRWQNGKASEAIIAVANGRELDRDASNAEIARVGDSDEARSFRSAVGA